MVVTAVVIFISSSIFNILFTLIGQKLSYEFKWRYLKALMTKDSAWYDSKDVNKLCAEIFIDCDSIQNGIGYPLGFFIFNVGASIAGIIVSFYISVYLCVLYSLIIPYVFFMASREVKAVKERDKNTDEAYAESGANLEQALNSIKIVKAYGQEKYEVNKFTTNLRNKELERSKSSWKLEIYMGLIDTAYNFGRIYSVIVGAAIILLNVSLELNLIKHML